MYIPKHFDVTDWNAITNLVSKVAAVDLVTVDESGNPVSTLLPCLWDTSMVTDNNFGTLIMHMARQNKQWKSMKAGSRGLANSQWLLRSNSLN